MSWPLAAVLIIAMVCMTTVWVVRRVLIVILARRGKL